MRQHVRFCTSFDGTRLAFAFSGEGPPLVRAPHWFTHLEHDWTNPAMRPWVEDLSKRYRLLRFDQRGTGMSDREVREISPEAHARDLEAVVEAAGVERFALIGLSQGAAYAIAYTANHPERVSHLVICGGFARGWAKRGWSAERMEEMETMVKLIEFGWGSDEPSFRQVFTSQFMPDASLEVIRGFNAFMPLTASARTAARIFKTNSALDVQADARRIGCPTLVLHGSGEIRIPFEEGRLIAGLVPGARFVTLETRNHLMRQDEPAWRQTADEGIAGRVPVEWRQELDWLEPADQVGESVDEVGGKGNAGGSAGGPCLAPRGGADREGKLVASSAQEGMFRPAK